MVDRQTCKVSPGHHKHDDYYCNAAARGTNYHRVASDRVGDRKPCSALLGCRTYFVLRSELPDMGVLSA